MENQTIQESLAPPKIRYLDSKDFIDNLFLGKVVEILSIPNKNFSGVVDTELVLEAQSGMKKKFSLWGDNYNALYNFCKSRELPTVGRTVTLRINMDVVNGKTKVTRTIEKIE